MSAFMCSDYHIAALIKYASENRVTYYWNDKSHDILGHEQEVFSKLYCANNESINVRYRENTPPMPSKYLPDMHRTFSAVEIIKSCNCFNYQACEVENYEETEAEHIVTAIKGEAIRNLPGYDEADWGLEPRKKPQGVK